MDWNDTIWSRASSTVNYVCCCVRHSKKQLERESPFKRAKLATIVYTINARGENDCLKWLPPPSWRYTTAQRCHVANRRTVAKCQLSYVDLRPSHMRGAIIRTHTHNAKKMLGQYLPTFATICRSSVSQEFLKFSAFLLIRCVQITQFTYTYKMRGRRGSI